MMNSRLSYRELAEKLDLSVNAVHKRIKAMTDSGIIRAFTAEISLAVFGAIRVLVFGRSDLESVDGVQEKLRKNDSIYWVLLGGGNYLYVGACVKEISQLNQYVSFVKNEAKIEDPVVAIMNTSTIKISEALHPLDYQIIYSLRKDSRRPASDVAEELGVSAKTVHRRLERMLHQGAVELSIEWYPDASNDVFAMTHLKIKPAANNDSVGVSLMQKYNPNLITYFSFSNLPNLLLGFVWANTLKELKGILERIHSEEVVESSMSNVPFTGYIFDTWRDKLLIEKGKRIRTRSAE
jgi:DNA-binding Lrp family transcriptional regulator